MPNRGRLDFRDLVVSDRESLLAAAAAAVVTERIEAESGEIVQPFGRATEPLLPGMVPAGYMLRMAEISECGKYRYSLSREWVYPPTVDPRRPNILFVMLNPSTGDANSDDPTIRRCVSFAESMNGQRLTVGNLFAYRATNPNQLKEKSDSGENVVGPENGDYLMDMIDSADMIVAAWGDCKWDFVSERAGEVCLMVARTGREMVALGTTKEGHPRHPLYLSGDSKPRKFHVGAL